MKVIAVLPAEIPVTRPELFTVAIDGDDVDQGLKVAAVPEPVRLVVVPTQTFLLPVITGTGFTDKVIDFEQPLEFV